MGTHDAKLVMDMSTAKKLAYKWMGPYHVRNAIPEKGMYELEEFNGTPVPGTHPGNQLKKFVKCNGFYELVNPDNDEEEHKKESEVGEEGDEGNNAGSEEGAGQNVMMEDPQPEQMSKRFEIVLPQLTVEQRREYAQYEEDDEGNIL